MLPVLGQGLPLFSQRLQGQGEPQAQLADGLLVRLWGPGSTSQMSLLPAKPVTDINHVAGWLESFAGIPEPAPARATRMSYRKTTMIEPLPWQWPPRPCFGTCWSGHHFAVPCPPHTWVWAAAILCWGRPSRWEPRRALHSWGHNYTVSPGAPCSQAIKVTCVLPQSARGREVPGLPGASTHNSSQEGEKPQPEWSLTISPLFLMLNTEENPQARASGIQTWWMLPLFSGNLARSKRAEECNRCRRWCLAFQIQAPKYIVLWLWFSVLAFLFLFCFVATAV